MDGRPGPAGQGISTAIMTLLAPISWGTTCVTITELLPPDRPLLVTAMRVAPAGALLGAVGFVRSAWWPTARQWRDLTVLAALNFGLFFPLLVLAAYRLPGGIAASVGGVQPLLVGTITWLALGTAMRPREVVVGVVAAVGVALVVIRPGAAIDLVGVAAAVVANLSFSAGVVATKNLSPPPDRLAGTGWQLVIASLLIAPVAWLVEGPPPDPSAAHLVGFAYLSLIATGGAFVVWFLGIERLPVQVPPLLGLAAPITGAALGWIVLGEDLSLVQVVGLGTTIAAICYGAMVGGRGVAGRARIDSGCTPQLVEEQLHCPVGT